MGQQVIRGRRHRDVVVSIRRLGRWRRAVTLLSMGGRGIPVAPEATTWGERWTRWRARRMLARYLRRGSW